ncbi:MAG TPA: MATE family efflux transporter [Kofleriaceae bacterium]
MSLTARRDATARPLEPVLSRLLPLAIPLALGKSTEAVRAFVDALVVAPLGHAPLAAVTTGAADLYILIVLLTGIVTIIETYAAQTAGTGDLAATQRYGWYGIVIALASTLLTLALTPATPALVSLLGYRPELQRDITGFIQLRLLGVGAVVGFESLGHWFSGVGRTRIYLAAALFTIPVHGVLDWLLVHGHCGLPALGVRGAALSGATTMWLAFAALFMTFRHRAARSGRTSRLRCAELRSTLRFGLPVGVSWMLEYGALATILNYAILPLGTTTLAAVNSAYSICYVSSLVSWGLASGGAILVGQAIGRGARHEVPRIIGVTTLTVLFTELAVGAAFWIGSEAIMSWFAAEIAHDGEMVYRTITILRLVLTWQICDTLALSLAEALRGAGDTFWVMAVRASLTWLGLVPAAVVCVYSLHLGYAAVLACLIGNGLILVLAFSLRLRNHAWTGIVPTLR